MKKTSVQIAAFAHNEELSLKVFLEDLSKQELLFQKDFDVHIHILCNGCTDRSAEIASEVIESSSVLSPIADVRVFLEGGKSRTWNRFISEVVEEPDCIIFMDADIRISDRQALRNLLEDLLVSEDVVAATSRPVKNVKKTRNALVRCAAKSIGSIHRDGPIAGSLYIVRWNSIRDIRMPVPCLVEDGFLSACLITSLFNSTPNPKLVRASKKASHIFYAPLTLKSFFNHDVRLAVGTELNAALYTALWAAVDQKAKIELLRNFSEGDNIAECISEHLSHPERSALTARMSTSKFFSRRPENSIRWLVMLPLRTVHAVYTELVRRRAIKLFNRREFKW